MILNLSHEQRQDNRHAELNTKMHPFYKKYRPNQSNYSSRILLNREDIFAMSAGDVLMVSKCKEISELGKQFYFIQPGTRDLVKASPRADCGHLPFGIYNDGNNQYKSASAQENFIFNSPPIFHSDLAKISTDLYLIKNHLNSINNMYAGPSKSTTEDKSMSNQLGHELADTAFLESNAGFPFLLHFFSRERRKSWNPSIYTT
ncbi:hypothetical protein OSTOST_14548 [Ostertagia ostertagi]